MIGRKKEKFYLYAVIMLSNIPTYISFQLLKMSAWGNVVARVDGKDTMQLWALVEQKMGKWEESRIWLWGRGEINILVEWLVEN